jgi:hypothetical protein
MWKVEKTKDDASVTSFVGVRSYLQHVVDAAAADVCLGSGFWKGRVPEQGKKPQKLS